MESKICEICGKEYFKKSSHSKKYWKSKKYCSIKCKNEAMKVFFKGRIITWGDKISLKKKGHEVSEETRRKIGFSSIGRKHTEEWIKNRSGKNNHFWKGGRPKCKECGKIISYGSNYCVKCMGKLKISAHFGKDNKWWRGGISKENDKLRHVREIKIFREECLKRDNYTCQKYGIKEGKLVVHHIDCFKNFPLDRYRIENGITLSEKAHKEFHKKYGYHNNTRVQLEEFLQV